ncbi:MAG: nitroreductase family protein [Candidatus Micrarchaeia archaeon]
MEFFEVLKNRHSVRKFKDMPVEEEKLQKILEAANSAPSAGDLQAYEIVVVRDKERKNKLVSAAYEQEFIAKAPVVLVFVAHPERSSRRYGRRGAELYCIQDATIATAYAQLAATALGLSCVWVGAFDEKEVAKVINAKENLKPVSMLPIGYADEQPRATPRRGVEELVHEEKL